MTQETNTTPVENTNTEVKSEIKDKPTLDTSTIETLVADRVKSELSKIKSSLDGAYAERDEAKLKIKELDKAKQKAEIEALEAAGKHSEVLKIEMNEIKNELDLYKKRNTELTRDNVVKSQLSGLEFRNEKAASLAHADIIGSLKQDSTGNWMHESGSSVVEAIDSYAKSEANAFMFKVKENAGSAVTAPKATTKAVVAPAKGTKIQDMTQDEVLKAIEAGTLNVPGTWNQ